MAVSNSLSRPKSLLLISRSLTTTSTTTTSSSSSTIAAAPALSAQIFDVDDSEKLFSSVPTRSLVASLANLYLIAIGPVVDIGSAVMRSGLMERDGAARRAVLAGLKRTVYAHFCAGEDVAEASRTLRALWDEGLRGILDYGLEDAEDNEACDRNLVEFLTTVEMTTSLPPSSVSFACVKITAICPISLLHRVSDLLRWQHRDPSLHLPWKLHSFPVLTESSPLYHTPSPPPPLSSSEHHDLTLALGRLSSLSARCAAVSLPLLVDAEYTSVQPAIDHLTYSAMLEFNRGGAGPIVFGTVQAYLRDSMERLATATAAAERERVAVGFKLVRGAYLSRETKLASELGVPSPVHGSIGETHSCYNRCAEFMLEKVAGGNGSVVLATHNLESGKAAASKAEELGIAKGDQRLQFAQLKGMAEALSLGLRNAGFNVSKYLAFGPVENVVPYLLRRAEENRGLLSASTLDRQLMRRELRRRVKNTILGR